MNKTFKERFRNFKRRFIKPFWFSSKCDYIKVPYVYGTVIMILFVASIIVFLHITLSQSHSPSVLMALSAMIATLAGLYFGILKLYNNGIELKQSSQQTIPESPPQSTGGPVSSVVETITKKLGRPRKEVD